MKSFIRFALLFLWSSILLFSCKERNKTIIPSSDFAAYVNAYTGGIISAGSTIRIELTRSLPSVELNKEIGEKLFSFTPSIKGKSYWLNNNTIEFVPDSGQLKQGTLYNASFKLHKITDVTGNLKEFPFSFRVAALSFAINTAPINITVNDNRNASITGNISFSDEVPSEMVKKILSCKSESPQEPQLSVETTDNPLLFHFVIDNIQRQEKDYDLHIIANGKPLGIDKKTEETITIPALKPFKVLSADILSGEQAGIEVVFSEPLSGEQDLQGLIDIPELSYNSYVFQQDNNKVNLFLEDISTQELTVEIDKNIRSHTGETLASSASFSLSREPLKPAVRIPLTGNILPDSKNLTLPFQAVSLSAVDLKIIRIFEHNILTFLQDNDLSGSYELRRSGRLVYKKTIFLDSDPTKDLNTWQDFSIDLAGIFRQEPGAIYRIQLSFKQDYSLYPCGGSTVLPHHTASEGLTKVASGDLTEEEEEIWDYPEAYYYENNIDWELYDWEERDDPCKPSYYMGSDRVAECNVMASDIGLIAKIGAGNKLWVTANDILTTAPIKDAAIEVYNFQLQTIGSGKTDENGFCTIGTKGKPFVITAQSGTQKSYLKVTDGTEKSLSRFDIGGKELKKGLKGYIYGERGVWRPGDTLHVAFILEDKEKKIPDNHPVTMEIYNPRGQFYDKQTLTSGINGFYVFHIPTQTTDPTGSWNTYIKVGGAAFHKSLRVETVKPNRLKIDFTLPGKRLDASQNTIPATLSSAWLTGANAGNLKAKVEMTLSKSNTRFKGYEKYCFNNPATDFHTGQSQLFDGTLDAKGEADISLKMPQAKDAPGMLQANIICQVFEPGGDASIFTQAIPFSPFDSYVGINLNEQQGDYIETDTDHSFDIVTLNADGNPVSRSIDYKVYKLNWSWWWESQNESLDSYVNGTSAEPILSGTVNTVKGRGAIPFRIEYPEWGRYLVYVKDTQSGHASGGIVYADWPSWRGRADRSDPSGLTMLTFSTDKKSYDIGEEATVIIPAAAKGRALIAFENGSSVIRRDWAEISEGKDTPYKFKITENMAPNFYIHISLLQPHEQTVNDLPIRMYGVVPVSVNNKNSVLAPQITMPDVLRPEKEFEIRVKEKTGKPMTYTLAIVDDGLLDLTNFKTPDPWAEFYAREALGIRTWDIYDYVIGAFSGRFNPLFSVGGDESLKPSNQRSNRFKPVVKFLGPFTLQKGENRHTLKLPMYVGSVRVMVVAGQNGAYGKTEKTVPVRTPLMVLSTLPRIISTGEQISMPVNVFAMEENVKNAAIKIETSGLLKVSDGNSRNVAFSQPGDQLIFFNLESGAQTGTETVTVTATGNGQTATETINIEIRNPNPSIITTKDTLLQPGAEQRFDYRLNDRSGEEWVKLEVSRIPSVDISRRLDFLYDYQHYCTEQLTSKAMPLLFISQFKELNKEEEAKTKQNIVTAIQNIYGRQLPDGGFVYWPGQSSANEWITSYAGNFLIEAQQKGYEVNQAVLRKWKDFQRQAAQNWSGNDTGYYLQSDLQQAYRLYTLALAGSPEQGAMNRMKEMQNISVQAKWRLAAAYAVNGKQQAANEIVWNIRSSIEPYSQNNATFGSYDRDDAMILETMVLLGNLQEALKQAQVVSENLKGESYFSTQSTAFGLIAMGRLAEKAGQGNLEFDWSSDEKETKEIRSSKAIYQTDIPISSSTGEVSVKNRSKGDLYISLTTKSRPVIDRQPEIANNLKIDVDYLDMEGRPIQVDALPQGTDFTAIVKVSNISGTTDYDNLALTHIVPSGWEIFNERLFDTGIAEESDESYTYRDIRDDRILTYFDLPKGRSKTFRIRLQAAYPGTFILPAIQCEAMYDTQAQARTTAGKIKVTK